jgi:hypothetical protein
MKKALLAFSAAAVALTIAAPAEARRTGPMTCAQWHHHHCMAWRPRAGAWNVGYVFGPNYGYSAYNTIPRVYAHRYNLDPNYRYVHRGNRLYVVDPGSYAVTRVITVPY